ncbi:hypothetical protein PENSPDRAFT_489253 [Peniophora sp. CONT]|nr:hypothetical protein PENSPDRAFT_489253 [Peniophora sp. CONT]
MKGSSKPLQARALRDPLWRGTLTSPYCILGVLSASPISFRAPLATFCARANSRRALHAPMTWSTRVYWLVRDARRARSGTRCHNTVAAISTLLPHRTNFPGCVIITRIASTQVRLCAC